MKAQPANGKKRRRRIEGEIEALARTDIDAAQELAMHGKRLNEIEKTVWQYLFGTRQLKDRSLSEKLRKGLTPYVYRDAARLAEIFFDAVNTNDQNTLSEIAIAVKNNVGGKLVSPKRALMLSYKQLLEKTGEAITKKALAKILRYKEGKGTAPSDIPDKELTKDELAVLGRLAKKLGVPIKAARDK